MNLWFQRPLPDWDKSFHYKDICYFSTTVVFKRHFYQVPFSSLFCQLDSLFHKFMWSNKSNGGLNWIDLKLFTGSLKCKCFKLYLSECKGEWKAFSDPSLKHYGGWFPFECNCDTADPDISNTLFMRFAVPGRISIIALLSSILVSTLQTSPISMKSVYWWKSFINKNLVSSTLLISKHGYTI